jgi:TPR repeat protein
LKKKTRPALACAYWESGDVRRAFELFLALAERGDAIAQLNLGYFFDCGIAVEQDETKALYWYRRAYLKGDPCGANNIGTIYRDRGELRRAAGWFLRAIKGGDDGSALTLAQMYLAADVYPDRALKYLKIVTASNTVSESEQEEAARLLEGLAPTRSRTREPRRRSARR